MSDSITVDGRDLIIPFTEQQNEVFYETVERFLCLPKGRRFGATSGCAGFCIDNLLDNKKILWVDTIQTNLDKYFYRYFMPVLRQIKTEYWGYRQAKELRLLNGFIDFRSAEKPQNIEGFAYDIIIINEAGIVLKGQKGRDLWYNTIYPMILDFKARVYFVGTPKGKKAKKDEAPAKTSLYYELALKGGLEDPEHDCHLKTSTYKPKDDIEELLEDKREADDKATKEALHKKEPNWKTIQVTSFDNPLLDPIEIEEMEADVPRVTRAQEIHGKFKDIGDEEIFHEEWFRIVYELPPDHLWLRKIISFDTAFKKGAENDDTAGICVLETKNFETGGEIANYFIVDCFCEKLEFPELVKRAKEFYLRHERQSQVHRFLIEDKATGTPLIQTFKRSVNFPVKDINPITDKVNRAVAITPTFEDRKVALMYGWWNDMLVDQLCDFNAKLDTPDDIVDAVSQAFNYLRDRSIPSSTGAHRKRQYKSKVLKGYE
jgi:predicted phage terminase large subunit-like protein